MGIRVVARVLVQNDGGELLLCQSRSGAAWVPPGGTLEEGESLAEAASREALEEAGIAASVGALAYVKEFVPKGGHEQVVELFFRAKALEERPLAALMEQQQVEPLGPSDRPWAAWRIRDVDGPRREVRWFSREALAGLPEPVFPAILKDRFWNQEPTAYDLYLGREIAK